MPLAQHAQYFSLLGIQGPKDVDGLSFFKRPELREGCSTSILPVKCDLFRKGRFLARKKRDNEIRHKDFRNEESNVYELENKNYEEAGRE